jgi:hypothetical protein
MSKIVSTISISLDGTFPAPVELELIRRLESPTTTHVRYRVIG